MQEERKQVIPYPMCEEIEGEKHELVPYTIRAPQTPGMIDDTTGAADGGSDDQVASAVWQVDKNKTNSVKVLSGPSNSNSEVGTLKGFDKVTEYEKMGDWIRISANGDAPRWVLIKQGSFTYLQRLHIGAEVQVTDVSAIYTTAASLASTLEVSSSWKSGNKAKKDDVGVIISETIGDNSIQRRIAIQLKGSNKIVLMALQGCKLLDDPTVS